MYKSNSSFTNSFFGGFALDKVINRHQDHLLVKINQTVKFDGFNEEVSACYSKDGRHAWQPITILKILIIQFLYNLSDREVIDEIDTDIVCRWFVGLSLDDDLPHFTRLNHFKSRITERRFSRLFNLIVKACRNGGLVSDELRIIDTTDQRASVNLAKLKKMYKRDDDDHTYIDRHSRDRDAGMGYKSEGKKTWHGYKAATLVEPESQIVTGVETFPANERDSYLVKPLVEQEIIGVGSKIEDLGGDKGFLGETVRRLCHERHINDYIIPRKNSYNHIEGKDSIGFYIAKWKRSAVERVYADTKRKQGLDRCRYIGIDKTGVQNILTFMAYNLKRIVKVVKELCSQKSPPDAMILYPFRTS